MLNRLSRIALFAVLTLLLASCAGRGGKTSEPFFKMRGVILSWDDVKTPESIDWISLIKQNGLNTVSVFGCDPLSEEFLAFRNRCGEEGIDIEFEDHAMSSLLPRELFATHPEYFRMDKDGVRQPDGNGCPSCAEGLEVLMSNVPEFVRKHQPTNHKYYTWLFDGGDVCHCEKCKGYNVADQGLIFENHIIKALRKIDPEAQLAHLAYHNSTEAPSCVKPEEGIFLEFAPFFRTWDQPLKNVEAVGRDGKTTHGEYLRMLEDNLKVFPAETAQVLDYWMDDSLYSGWKKPQVRVPWNREVFLSDLQTYASYGIRNITAYAVYVDEYYVKTYGDISFVSDYGLGLLNFKLDK